MSAAERALELADKIQPNTGDRDTIIMPQTAAEIAAILRHYAEILSAEPVAYIGAREAESLTKSMTHAYVMPAKVYENDVPLIRRPGEPT